MESISVTVPLEAYVIKAAAAMFTELAAQLNPVVEEPADQFSPSELEQAALKNPAATVFNHIPPTKELLNVPSTEPEVHPLSGQGNDGDETIPEIPEELKPTVVSDVPWQPASTKPVPPPIYSSVPIEIGNVELDENGLPWDRRIHASSKSRVSGNTWRYKRSLDETIKATVEAELRTNLIAPVTVSLGAAEMVTAAKETEIEITGAPAMLAVGAPPITFVELTQKITAAKIPAEMIAAVISDVGLTGYPMLALRADLVPAVDAALFPVV